MNRVKHALIARWLFAASAFGENCEAAQAAAHSLHHPEVACPSHAVHWLLAEMRKGGVNCDLALDLVCEFQANGQIERSKAA